MAGALSSGARKAGKGGPALPGAPASKAPARAAAERLAAARAAVAPSSPAAPTGPASLASSYPKTAAFIASLGLSPDTLSFQALSALTGEGLTLNAANVNRLRQAALGRQSGASQRDQEMASRVVARAMALGLDGDDALIDRVLSLCGHGAGSGHGADPHGREAGADADDGVLYARVPRSELLAALTSVLPRALADALAQPDLARLAAPGKDGRRWLIAPFDLSVDNVDFWGSFRILLYRNETRTRYLVADVRSRTESRLVAISGQGPSMRFTELDRDLFELDGLEQGLERSV